MAVRTGDFCNPCCYHELMQPDMRISIKQISPDREHAARRFPENPHEAPGHRSKAVHRAYAKRALMKLPSLQEYEERAALAAPAAVGTIPG
jgi:hypothetical protein